MLASTRYIAMKDRPEGAWLSGNEIAEYLGVRPDTVYKRMPAHKADEMAEWVRSGKASKAMD